MRLRLPLAALLILLAGITGCSSSMRLYVNPDADMSYYTTVAVAPFTNFSGERYAGQRVSRAFLTELMISRRFNVVSEGDYTSALDRVGGGTPNEAGLYDPAKLRSAATEVKATGVIVGTVTEYQTQRIGGSASPVLTFDVQMEDVATGTVVWRASITSKGKGRLPLLGGTGTRTFGRLVQVACEDMVNKLESQAF